MNLIFDTNIVIELTRGNQAVIDILKNQDMKIKPYITIINYSELLYGVLGTKKEIDFKKFLENNFSLLTITRKSAENFAKIKHELKDKGKIIPDLDIYIAAIALDIKAKVLTGDKHFTYIKGLNLKII